MVTRSGAIKFGKRIASDFSEKNVPFMAAALAYHAFISLAPMLLLLFLVLAVVRALVGETGFWTELAIVLLIAVSYRPVVRRLGVAPSAWKEQ